MLRFTRPALFVAIVALSSLILLAPGATRVARAAEDTELAKKMESIQENLKKLRKTIKTASENAASLEAISKMQADTVASKAMTPAKAATVKEADRAKFVAGYRKEMAGFLTHLCKIETALLDNDNVKAEELFKELKKIEDDGHEKFSDQ